MVSSSLASVAPMPIKQTIPLECPSQKAEVPPPAPKGLKNVGNTCYANAALQCLLSTALSHALLDPRNTVKFRRYSSNHNLLKAGSGSVDSQDDCLCNEAGNDSSSDSCNASNILDISKIEKRRKAREERIKQRKKALSRETCKWLSGELTDITRRYTALPLSPPQPSSNQSTWSSFFFSTSTNDDPDNVVDPGRITRHVSKLSPTLQPYQQEDAHEFMRALLSTLTLDGFNRKLSSLFDGLLESAVTCQTCGHASMTRDRYMDLSLDIASRKIVDLQSALKHFTKTELLDADNKVDCPKCRTKRVVSKGLRLATAPTILVCHLKRFGYDCYGRISRLDDFISYPLHLEIGDYMSRANRGKPPPYELVGVLVHSGNTCHHGHYVAYVKSGKQWYKANDHEITPVDLHNVVLKQKAYILIYEVAGMRKVEGLENFSHYHHGKTTPTSSQHDTPGSLHHSDSRSWDQDESFVNLDYDNTDPLNDSSIDLLRHTRHNMYDLKLSPETSRCPSPVQPGASEDESVPNHNTIINNTHHCKQNSAKQSTGDNGNAFANSQNSSTLFHIFNSCGLSHTFESMRDSLFGEESHCCPSRGSTKEPHDNIIVESDTATTCTHDEEQSKVAITNKSQTQFSTTDKNDEQDNELKRPQQAFFDDDKSDMYPDDEVSISLDGIRTSPERKPAKRNGTSNRQQKFQNQGQTQHIPTELQELPSVLHAPPMRRCNTSADLAKTEIQAAKAYINTGSSSSRDSTPARHSESSSYSPHRSLPKNLSKFVNINRCNSPSPSSGSDTSSRLLSSPPQSPKSFKTIMRDYGSKKKFRPRSLSRDATKPIVPTKVDSFTPTRPPLSSPYSQCKTNRSKSLDPTRR